MRVLVAFDSFKGSISAQAACAAAADGLRRRFGDTLDITEVPMADGGEGSLELLTAKLGLDVIGVQAPDAIGRMRETQFRYDDATFTAYIEVAQMIGLPGVSDVPLRPMEASSYGVGVVAAAALAHGAKRLVMFLGGSATSDGGTGLLRGLGASFCDASGAEIPLGGGALGALDHVDVSGVLASARTASWTFITDVAAPLLGPTGAAMRYAPQKGASQAEVRVLEAGLARAAEVLGALAGAEPVNADAPFGSAAGFGAAGGMAVAPAALFETSIVHGGPFLARMLGAEDALAEADIVITGEGRFDAQSLDGKVVGTLAALAQQRDPRPIVIVIAGDTSAAGSLAGSTGIPGIAGAFSLAEGPAALDALQRDAATLIANRSAETVGLCLAARSR